MSTYGRAKPSQAGGCEGALVWSRAARLGGAFGALWLGAALAVGCVGSLDGPAGSRDCHDCGPDGSEGTVLPLDPDEPPGVGDPNTPDGVGWSTRFTRLSNVQWEHSVRDLFFFDEGTDYAEGFTQEPRDKGYRNQAAAELTIAGDAWTRYQAAAERVAADVARNSERLSRLLPADVSEAERARGLVTNLGRRTFRRPLREAEVESYLSLFAQGPEHVGGDGFSAGARLVIEAMLQSPHFLYRVEAAGLDEGGTQRKAQLSGYEIATRLAYGFWDTTPSDELLTAAESGELADAKGVARWARSMLKDPRAARSLLAFHEETFGVGSYGTQDKDPALGFDAAVLAPLLKEEAVRFFQEVLVEKQGGIGALLTEPVAYVNETTAQFYGIAGVSGQTLSRQELDPEQRAGFLTQLGFLSQNATRSSTDPVHRGLLVLRKVLCDEPDPPPMMFDLPKAEPGSTTREVYEKATACGASCHAKLINPPGFAFEGFDTLGRFRETEQGKPVDPTGSLLIRSGYTPESKATNPSKELTFSGPVDLLQQLATEARVHECYARNWMRYLLNREPNSVERGAWEKLGDLSSKRDSAQDLVVDLVQLETFRARVTE